MTKVISLSDRAYQELRKRTAMPARAKPAMTSIAAARHVRRREKSGRWTVDGKRSDSILQHAGRWVGDDADEVLGRLMKERRATKSREFDL